MMAGVTEPQWWSRFYLASKKYETSQLYRFKHAPDRSVHFQLPTYRCGAANRRFGPICDMKGALITGPLVANLEH